ncbi:hypothetical protein [Corynebacterium sp.]|uniref:hypothetical protein n=1 Tax=Corynebacterium sp. TaxID=1720 RepID=UPI0029055CAF|nr:hypothetical protein [Corynebacterium sp.]MDU3111448.1 hypothetical protein [Corynebacterium sp.]
MTDKPRVWKAGQNCWAVTDDYFCEELGETMNTVTMFRTWQQAINYVAEEGWK